MSHLKTRCRLIVPLLVAALAVMLSSAVVCAEEQDAKIDPWVLDRLATTGEAEFLVILAEQADLGGIDALRTKREKGRFVLDRLRKVADRTQPAVVAEIQARGLDYRRFWVANMVWVRADAAAVAALAARDDVRRLSANPSVALRKPISPLPKLTPSAAPEVNLLQIGATGFWAAGFTGQGVVIGGADTGYDWEHPALVDTYRGSNGVSATHNYNWHDAIHSEGGVCGADSPEPCDDGAHGTHTMGIMVGDDGGANQVGVAPGARWIGCRNMDRGVGTPATYSECFQFFIAPTDLADENAMPEMAPDVVNGSWSCPPSEGCTDPDVLRTVVENTRAAGILVVQSAGNAGSSCSSVNTPAAIYEATLTVGAVDGSDNIAGFSSRGPVTVDGSNRLKPDVSAPGVAIRSSIPGGGYASYSGTSMAAPHVAGLVALLISAQGCLEGDPTAIERQIRDAALPRTTTQTCGGIAAGTVPNNTYGFGSVRAVVPSPSACNGIFGDGFESGNTSLWAATVP
ncbi:MAG: S8 family serine peptidase [Acidobacteriota bacterium]|nr:S8 family serine peptidase [Acidobacteriota bacterium]